MTPLIDYRTFHNGDVPALVSLWKRAGLGPGAAVEVSCDSFDLAVFAQIYFDPKGLIVALHAGELVGFAHAGFAANENGTGLEHSMGVISMVVVDPNYRRQGIGRALIERARAYIEGRGASECHAGESPGRNPFYLGLYGSADSVGFLDSDVSARPFLTKLGYSPRESYRIYRLELVQGKTPFEPRAVKLKKQIKFGILDRPPEASWWWMCRLGRYESLSFTVIGAADGQTLAQMTCWVMDQHSMTQRRRLVGLGDLWVIPAARRQGLARILLCEVFRRLAEDGVTDVEVVVPSQNLAGQKLFESLGFQVRDTGTSYLRPNAESGDGSDENRVSSSVTVELGQTVLRSVQVPK